VVGAATALFAATIAVTQTDLKKVLAYSTVSQLGFMFLACGLGAFGAGFFHVFTHAFFKACLFLGAGAVMHAMHARIHDTDASQDMWNMGGLRKYMPMFRSYFLTFWGDFRGWKIVPGWKDPNPHHAHDDDHAHDDHAHAHHEKPGEMDGPVPHESPLPMTVPLMVLGAFALVAGFLGAEPIHVAPLMHKLEPIFARANTFVGLRAGVEAHGAQMWTMMAPGVAAFAGGSFAAFAIYKQQGGAPELSFKRSMPGLYNLMYEKWRIDELYDATVIGMVDALADIFTMADKWIVDGIIARLTGMVTQAAGAILRVMHTGRVQIYAASMVVGVVGTGYFFVQPHAHVTVDDAELKTTGKVIATVSPGLGYTYTWSGEGVKATSAERVEFTVEQGKTRELTVTVKNVFGREAQAKVSVSRPAPQRPMPGQGGPVMIEPRPQQQGALDALPPSGPPPGGSPPGSPPADPPARKPMVLEGAQLGQLERGGVQQ
jgi:NADH:ubiquinone oxidoreductase subunit 5 (subunit L)/multisubunit Na+/H+ antiporter MnhA subunit